MAQGKPSQSCILCLHRNTGASLRFNNDLIDRTRTGNFHRFIDDQGFPIDPGFHLDAGFRLNRLNRLGDVVKDFVTPS
ncbi:MAG: hypothetical protein HPY30_01190 [Gammaproteobacteria bacterium (ex Lamellibrachia satsuma)]|nr:MAG: hypothetical protein HPY30_01190 [Gammaproteobacteria bacterium (ex Lamellibrachia satsuma)]